MKTYFFKSIPISIIGIIFSFQATQFVHAAEVPCSNYSASLAGTCTQCFDEGSIYRGEAVNSFKDTYINSSPNTEIMFEDTWWNFSYTVLQPGSGFRDSGNFLQFTPNLTWDIYNGRRYTVFAPNSRTEFLRFAPGHGIVFETATNTMNRNSPALRMEVLSKTQSYSNGALDSNFIVHKECAFVTPRWCGDGVVDSGESCDSGNQNGQNWATCSNSCAVVPVIGWSFDLSIKKFVNNTTQDAQDGNPVDLFQNTAFQYIVRAKNEGPIPTSGITTVSDPGPDTGVNFTGTPFGVGWLCTVQWRGFSCTTTSVVQPWQDFNEIVVQAVTTNVTGTFRNLATVANPNENPAGNYGNNNSDPANVRVLTPSVTPTCVGLVATPSNGWVALNSSLSCSYSNVPANTTLRIDCGNGSAVANIGTTANGGPFQWSTTCNYLTSGTFTPTCTIFTPTHSITSPACTTSVTAIGENSTLFDLTLKKYVDNISQDAQDGLPVAIGIDTNFNYIVRVTNNGSSITSGTTTVTDPGPTAGVDFIGTPYGTDWTCSRTGRTISCASTNAVPSGSNFPDITIPAVTTNVTGTFRNLATVANPNENPAGNYGNNNSDPANVIVTTATTASVCSSLTSSLTTNPHTPSYSSVLTCAATAAAGSNPTYRIDCGNGTSINSSTGTCNYSAFATNHASCSVNGELAADIPNSCRADITSTSIGGGGGSICERLTYTVVSAINGIYSLAMTCSATSAAGLNPPIRVDCGNGTSFTGATGICSYTTPISPVNMTAICYVNGSTQGLPGIPYGTMSYGSCKQSIAYSACPNCGGSSLPYCGNGIVDVWTKTISSPVPISGAQSCVAVTRQETQIVGGVARLVDVFDHYNCIVKTTETCDAGSANGGPINNDFCQNCQLHTTTTTPNASPLFISYHPFDSARPSGLPVSYYQWIIGNNVPVFDTGDRFAITSPFPTILSGNSAKFENISPLISPSGTINTTFWPQECIGAGSADFGSGIVPCTNQRTIFTVGASGVVNSINGGGSQRYLGDSLTVPTGSATADVNPPLSYGSAVLQNNFTVSVGFLKEPLRVRVSKQAVSNTAGGNAYIGAKVGYSVNTITNEFLSSIKSGNFVVTSNASNVGNSLNGADGTIGVQSAENINVGSTNVGTWPSDIHISWMADFNFMNFVKMGDAPNIYTIKKGTVTIDGDIQLKGIGTLLIEEGTLIINGNITYVDANSSWSFVVVKPDATTGVSIQIHSTVDTISGVYMALDGKMIGSAPSIVQLAVDGNVYANLSDLVNSRTFIHATEGSSALSTGVTINYSTRAFKNPPPLLSKYLEQYTLRKISR